MTLTSLGDMSTFFVARRNNARLKTDLARLTGELSSGRRSDLTAALRGDTGRLADIKRRLSLSEARGQAARETGDMLSVMQAALGHLDRIRGDLANRLLLVTPATSPGEIAGAASAAEQAFADIVHGLNTRLANQSLFAGRATDGPAVATADQMLALLRPLVSAETTAAGVAAVVDGWFQTPGGGFESLGYLGDPAGVMTRELDEGRSIAVEARADDTALRSLMSSVALAALAGPGTTALDGRETAALLSEAGRRLVSAAQPLVDLRAGIGLAEERVDQAVARHSARTASLAAMRNDIENADPFDTATALEEVRTQLETHYMLTARLADLSLVGYLR